MCGLSVRDSHACPAAAPQAGAEAEPGVRTWVRTGAPLSPARLPAPVASADRPRPPCRSSRRVARRRRGRGSHRDTPGPRLRPPSVPGPASAAGPDLTLGLSRAELALVSPDLRQLRDVPPPGSRGGMGADWAVGAGRPAACPECSPKPSRRPPGSGRVPAQGPGSPHGRTSGRNESGRAPHFVCPPRETLPVAGALQTEPRGTKTPRNAEKAPQTHGPLGRRRPRPRRGALTTASGVWQEKGQGL